MTVSSFVSPDALRHPASCRSVSGRPLDLATGVLGRSGGFLTGHRVFYREQIVRSALGRMGLADKRRAHQLVVSGAEFRCTRLQGDLRRQLESGKRMRQLRGVERLLLVGDHGQRLYRSIAEPVARGGRETGDLLHRGVEFRDVRYPRLIPPPLHAPPADARAVRPGADAFKLEQSATDRHLLVQSELNKLLEARSRVAATH